MHFFWKYKLDHVLFWSITIGFYAFVTADLLHEAGFVQYQLNLLIRNGLLALICYTHVYYLFPQYFRKGKYWQYALLIFTCLLLFTLLKNAHDTWLFGFVLHDLQKQHFFYNTFYNFSIALFYLSFTMALALSKNWYQQYLLLQKMQLEKLTTELQYLKAQMNPHFLFNSINTIYFQIDKSNVEARDSLQKFSDLLRYQLYECNEEQIAIEKEIDYVRSYMDLQRLRRQNNYRIQLTTEKDVCCINIAPLLLIPFVENAFKHVSNATETVNTIDVRLYRQKEYLMFDVVNTKQDKPCAKTANHIGLKNVKRRLELLYENRHELLICNEDFLFSVQLKLRVW